MAINGVVLLSSVLDFNAIDNGGGPGEDYGYIAFLPTWPRSRGTTTRSRATRRTSARFVARGARVRGRSVRRGADARRHARSRDTARDRRAAPRLHRARPARTSIARTCGSTRAVSSTQLLGARGHHHRPRSTGATRSDDGPHRRSPRATIRPVDSAMTDAIVSGVQRVRARRSRLQRRPSVSRHEHRRGGALGRPATAQLDPRRTSPDDLRAALIEEPVAPRVLGQRLLRSGDAVLRHRVHARPPRARRPRCARTSSTASIRQDTWCTSTTKRAARSRRIWCGSTAKRRAADAPHDARRRARARRVRGRRAAAAPARRPRRHRVRRRRRARARA